MADQVTIQRARDQVFLWEQEEGRGGPDPDYLRDRCHTLIDILRAVINTEQLEARMTMFKLPDREGLRGPMAVLVGPTSEIQDPYFGVAEGGWLLCLMGRVILLASDGVLAASYLREKLPAVHEAAPHRGTSWIDDLLGELCERIKRPVLLSTGTERLPGVALVEGWPKDQSGEPG